MKTLTIVNKKSSGSLPQTTHRRTLTIEIKEVVII